MTGFYERWCFAYLRVCVKLSDSLELELELQTVVSCPVGVALGAGHWTTVLAALQVFSAQLLSRLSSPHQSQNLFIFGF